MTATFNFTPNSANSNHNGGTDLEKAILAAIAEARMTCEQTGEDSPNCAVAWDIVEELQAEKSHQAEAIKYRTSLDEYCELHPEALECLIYDV
ncbi:MULTISPECIES: Calvin cycle protein CP12 [unclassified Anabaena]|uniref:Calvin cycle protein CP12 n=1 Tax=unclassified Anabaena TaxID=2619674 RepID=UPI00082C9799|nr:MULTISPECIES: Calvin cycle protein CP12 [unclassified Anabaena]